MVTELTRENFDDEVLAYDGRVLVDFWAEWCGPCMMLSPIVEEVSDEIDDVKFCSVNENTWKPPLSVNMGLFQPLNL